MAAECTPLWGVDVKMTIMIIGCNFPHFYLSGQVLCVCNKAKYVFHFSADKMPDRDDMYQQFHILYVNMLARKWFGPCYVSFEHIAVLAILLVCVTSFKRLHEKIGTFVSSL